MGTPANATPPLIEGKIIAALASGLTAKEVAKALGVHPATVYRLAKKEGNARLLRELREEIRARTLQAVKKTTPKALKWLDQVVSERTSARDADALSRAVLNLEKVAASTSGEQRRQDGPGKVELVVKYPEWSPVQLDSPMVIEVDADELKGVTAPKALGPGEGGE